MNTDNKLNIELIDIALVKPAEYNPRTLSSKKFEDIKDSLTNFGFVDPILLNSNPDRKNIIIGGHQRVKVAKEMGYKEVPAVYIELSEEKEKELNVRLNKNSGDWDFTKLSENFEKESLVDWGFDESEINQQIKELEKLTKKNSEVEDTINEKKYPIVPKYNEKYSTFMIFCNNEMDVHWMRNFLKLTEPRKDYKSNATAPSHVITAQDFQKIIMNQE